MYSRASCDCRRGKWKYKQDYDEEPSCKATTAYPEIGEAGEKITRKWS
jgi:hypothetical protein